MSTSSNLLEQATEGAYALKNNGVIIFPTDTVYGIGASLNSPAAIMKLYTLKERPQTQPTALLISSIDQIQYLSDQTLDDAATRILLSFWPGALTVILKRRQDSLFDAGLKLICGDTQKIGIRLPDHSLTLKLIEQLGCPIVASSANRRGQDAPATLQAIEQDLCAEVDTILNGKVGSGVASTVIDFTTTPYTLLRQGEITPQQLAQLRSIDFHDED